MSGDNQANVVKVEVALPLDVAAALHAAISQRGTSLDAFVREAIITSLAAPAVPIAAPGESGYQWKTLLLPDGTELAFNYKAVTHIARVEGGQLLHDGKPVSPSQFVCGVAGQTRNAWRDLSVRRPGDPGWLPAEDLRSAVETGLLESVMAAASVMADRVGNTAETVVTALGNALPTKQGLANMTPDRDTLLKNKDAILKMMSAVPLPSLGAGGVFAGTVGAALMVNQLSRRRKAKQD